jgi:glycerophosphoryl diester phosphodiesterase
MPALYNCIDLFAKGVLNIVEIDPRYTSDGVMIIMHDETVNRTTNGTGKVSEMAYEQIRQLRLKLPNGTITNDTVPTMRDFFKAAKGKIFIDLDYYEKVPTSDLYYLAKECGVIDQVMFSAGNHSDALNFLESVSPKGIIFSNAGSAENITAHKQRGIKITHITNSKILTTALVGTAVQSGLITSSELLNQNGITIDNEIKNNNDYSGLDAFVATGLNCVQTDLAPKVHTYLKSKGKRK